MKTIVGHSVMAPPRSRSNSRFAGRGVVSRPFGELPNGKTVRLYTLENDNGVKIDIMELGAAIVSIVAPNRNGKYDDIVLGFSDVAHYANDNSYFGAVIGRYANRVRNALFVLNEEAYRLCRNSGNHHLHGGSDAFNTRLWQISDSCKSVGRTEVTFSLRSENGDQGYPGAMQVSVNYALTSDNKLTVSYAAMSNADTVLNLTQHSYFNLHGHASGSVNDHELTIHADQFVAVDNELLPTGELQSVVGTAMDFCTARVIGERIDDVGERQLSYGSGYDHTWVLNTESDRKMRTAACLYGPKSGRELTIYTDQPGVHFYSGNFLDGSVVGKGRTTYRRRAGLCLETQHFPDSPNQSEFPSTVLRKGVEFTSKTIFEFGVRQF